MYVSESSYTEEEETTADEQHQIRIFPVEKLCKKKKRRRRNLTGWAIKKKRHICKNSHADTETENATEPTMNTISLSLNSDLISPSSQAPSLSSIPISSVNDSKIYEKMVGTPAADEQHQINPVEKLCKKKNRRRRNLTGWAIKKRRQGKPISARICENSHADTDTEITTEPTINNIFASLTSELIRTSPSSQSSIPMSSVNDSEVYGKMDTPASSENPGIINKASGNDAQTLPFFTSGNIFLTLGRPKNHYYEPAVARPLSHIQFEKKWNSNDGNIEHRDDIFYDNGDNSFTLQDGTDKKEDVLFALEKQGGMSLLCLHQQYKMESDTIYRKYDNLLKLELKILKEKYAPLYKENR